MGKALYIAEKPSVAREFAGALKVTGRSGDGYIESADAIVTWCVGHLVTMSYPEAYDEKYKRWSLQTLPFLPKEFKYEIIDGVAKQFKIVSGLLNRADVDTIYVCTDSGREGEYIYRLVAQMAGVKGKRQKRVWIDSQTEEEILRGVREAKDLMAYDNLAASAYLRAKEDYLMGINFSRALTLKYGPAISGYLRTDRTVVSVGRVMTCVLGMAVRREREIRDFVKTPFYRVVGRFSPGTGEEAQKLDVVRSLPFIEAEWRAVPGSRCYQHPCLYKENGFKERRGAEGLIRYLGGTPSPDGVPSNSVPSEAEACASGETGSGDSSSLPGGAPSGAAKEEAGRASVQFDPGIPSTVHSMEKKKEVKNPPLLYNLAELQNDCSKMFKISPDQTLKAVQELYEKKLVTYPRTDARVLSTAVAKEIQKNISGLTHYEPLASHAREALERGSYRTIAKTRYVNDKQITDHYAIIPTGQGLGALRSQSELNRKIYQVIGRRFLSIFYPAAVYQKISLELVCKEEHFFASFKLLKEPGYLVVAELPGRRQIGAGSQPNLLADAGSPAQAGEEKEGGTSSADVSSPEFASMLERLKKGAKLTLDSLTIKEGETSPPKRYTSGSMILAMENAGQLIEDEELRAQIKGSGIGTSATRAEILKKLTNIKYLSLNQKTQVLTPTLLGELIYEVVYLSIRQLLNPELTASWEKGLTYVAEGSITSEEYMEKLDRFVAGRTRGAVQAAGQSGPALRAAFDAAAEHYAKPQQAKSAKRNSKKGAE